MWLHCWVGIASCRLTGGYGFKSYRCSDFFSFHTSPQSKILDLLQFGTVRWSLLYFTLLCYVYILDPCKNVDCGSGLKCVPAERSYSCNGKASLLRSRFLGCQATLPSKFLWWSVTVRPKSVWGLKNIPFHLNFFGWVRPWRQKNVSSEELKQDY